MAIIISYSPLPLRCRHFSNPNHDPRFSRHSNSSTSITVKSRLLTLIADQDRGIKSQQNLSKTAEIISAIEELAVFGKEITTTDGSLSGTWRMLWTTEKEQLFIIKYAGFFGTKTGDVLQVIDVENKCLNNVITFPPFGVFFVRSDIECVSPQRVNFRFTSAVLRGKDWELPLPPFGQGCWLVGTSEIINNLKQCPDVIAAVNKSVNKSRI